MITPAEKLSEYERKRDFSKTSEPSGRELARLFGDGDWHFVVQRHRATRLHYDLRLEIDGVMVSWAVPKGPCMDPKIRRMAIHVEDHPLDYSDFEGVIPKGEYGAGDVIVWDNGTWTVDSEGTPIEQFANGELHLNMSGQKIRGRFMLIKTDRTQADANQWLMFKKKGDDAVAGWDTEAYPQSVLSGRTNDDVNGEATP